MKYKGLLSIVFASSICFGDVRPEDCRKRMEETETVISKMTPEQKKVFLEGRHNFEIIENVFQKEQSISSLTATEILAFYAGRIHRCQEMLEQLENTQSTDDSDVKRLSRLKTECPKLDTEFLHIALSLSLIEMAK